MNFRTYDDWKTTDEAAERAAEFEAERDRLADYLGCRSEDISDRELDEWLEQRGAAMIRFHDGPAAGVVLVLRRSPLFLRVVHRKPDGWDALDQLTDEVRHDESPYAYVRNGEPCRVHLRFAGTSARKSGFYVVSSYRFWPDQPDEPTMRSTHDWRQWTMEAAKTLQTAPGVPG